MPYFAGLIDIIANVNSDEEAMEFADILLEFGVCEGEQLIAYANFIGTTNGINVYYDYGADYYFFVVAEYEADDEYDGQPDEAQEWYDFDPDC